MEPKVTVLRACQLRRSPTTLLVWSTSSISSRTRKSSTANLQVTGGDGGLGDGGGGLGDGGGGLGDGGGGDGEGGGGEGEGGGGEGDGGDGDGGGGEGDMHPLHSRTSWSCS